MHAAGVKGEDLKRALAEGDQAHAEHRKRLGPDAWKHYSFIGGGDVGVGRAFPDRAPSPAKCTDVAVHICQQRVCVNQRLPVPVNDISTDAGFDGTFARVGNDGFPGRCGRPCTGAAR